MPLIRRKRIGEIVTDTEKRKRKQAHNGKKICGRCNKNKDVSEFNTDKKSKDGYYGYCKQCQKETAKERYAKK